MRLEPPFLDAPVEAEAGAPAVSVILPTYQRRKLVKQAVESVLAQTYRDFELIVVDDGSTDGTGEALPGLDERLRYQWQPNGGVAAARNAALRLARGSILAFLDSDDLWLRDHLAIVTEVLARFPEAVLVTTTPRHVIGGRAKPSRARLFEPLPIQFFANPMGYPSSMAARRDAVFAAGGFDEGLPVGEDSDLWTRMAFQGPFAMLKRHTIEKRYGHGLKQWGRRRGEYFDCFEAKVRRVVEGLERRPSRRERELKRQAEGGVRFIAAMRALDHHDRSAARAALSDACRLLPILSSEGELVYDRMWYLPRAHESAERLRHLVTAASAWPDPASDAALFLRACAAAKALRMGRPREAARQLAGWPARATPSFLRRSLPGFLRLARRTAHEYRHRVDDPADLNAIPVERGRLPESALVR